MKAKQALLKRFRITKNGKVLRRLTGKNHFRSKKTGQEIRKRRKMVQVSAWEAKYIKRMVGKIK
jgi:ribosomal protein L35